MTKLVLTDLPTDDAGLEPGTLFRHGNQLLVSVENMPYPTGFSITTSLGSVTVTV